MGRISLRLNGYSGSSGGVAAEAGISLFLQGARPRFSDRQRTELRLLCRGRLAVLKRLGMDQTHKSARLDTIVVYGQNDDWRAGDWRHRNDAGGIADGLCRMSGGLGRCAGSLPLAGAQNGLKRRGRAGHAVRHVKSLAVRKYLRGPASKRIGGLPDGGKETDCYAYI